MTEAAPKLNENETQVLALLVSGGAEFGYHSFEGIRRYVRLDRAKIRRACRSLTRKGLAQFGRGLWTEDGDPAGSGYAATNAGRELADTKLVDKYALRRWE